MKKGDLEPDSDIDVYDVHRRKGPRGAVWYRGAGKWRNLPPGNDGRILTTHGPNADPSWDPLGAAGVQMATGFYVGTGGANQDIVVGFTPDFIQVSEAFTIGESGIIAHRIQEMTTSDGPGQFCITISDLAGVGLPGIIPTTELTQPVASQFRVTGNLNIAGRIYYWVAFKKQP
jgi:hypothetical protein